MLETRINRDKAIAELCRRDFFYFLKTFWSVIIPEDPIYNFHIEYLCNEAQVVAERVFKRLPKEYDLIINISPGETKSTIFSVMLPAWCWIRDASTRVLTASYSSSLSTDLSVKSRDIIRSDLFKKYFPEIEIKIDQDGKTYYKNTIGGDRYATSTTGSVTGFHAHLIVVDDPIDAKGGDSDALREKANSFMDKTIPSRKVDKKMTPTILVMQRLHVNDCTGNMLNKGTKVKHICLPGELSDNVKPASLKAKYTNGIMNPYRLDKEALGMMNKALGSYGYAGQIMQRPSPEGGGIWRKWFIPIEDSRFPHEDELEMHGTDWDLAYTEKQTNSASAYVTAGKMGNDMYIDGLGWDWLEFPDLITYMKGKKQPHYIEAKASGKSAKQTLTRQGITAIEIKVDGGDKVARARLSTPFAEAGRVYIRKSLLEKLYYDEAQGILSFPNTGDDLADALSQSIQRLLNQPEMFFF